ncbi:MAG TPA: hypothetical protein VL172_09825 [Kofleriaceae bacterium]|nr:hypothetical protein [Kofleriaceae bacterium]
MKLRIIVMALALGLLGTASTGCIVRTGPGHSHQASNGHYKHSHRHCHSRGHGRTTVCHTHPHWHPGHH